MTTNQQIQAQTPSIVNYILEEQQWIPGYKAPFLFWVGMASATGFLVLGSLWIYHHNKSQV